MEDDDEIIYIALSNNIILYEEQKADLKDAEEIQMVDYIISRSLELLDSYTQKINNKEEQPIQRPKWK